MESKRRERKTLKKEENTKNPALCSQMKFMEKIHRQVCKQPSAKYLVINVYGTRAQNEDSKTI